MEDNIKQALREIESAENVRILYACGSGSRAWGFSSEDSDYDVRFLYVRPRDWYLLPPSKPAAEKLNEVFRFSLEAAWSATIP